MSEEGASIHERILYAAKNDDTDLYNEIVASGSTPFDINYQDGLGNTALHYAAQTPSPDVLELILETDGTDVDLHNRLDQDTPLHLACKLALPEAREAITLSLLEAGADPRCVHVLRGNGSHELLQLPVLHRSRNKYKQTPADLLGRTPVDEKIRQAMKQAEAELSIDMGQIAADDESGEEGSDSGEEA